MVTMDDEQTLREMRAERARQERDKEDFHNELAGREIKPNRFLPDNQTPKAKRERERESDRRFWDSINLQARLERFSHRLDELDRASIRALAQAELHVKAAEDRL